MTQNDTKNLPKKFAIFSNRPSLVAIDQAWSFLGIDQAWSFLGIDQAWSFWGGHRKINQAWSRDGSKAITLAQWLACWTHNPNVPVSNPGSTGFYRFLTKQSPCFYLYWPDVNGRTLIICLTTKI